jgi:hypothetical protein
MKTEENNYCNSCGSESRGKYCSNCGAPLQLQRIDVKYVISEIVSVVNFDKGIFYTIGAMLTKPGASVHQFIEKDRKRLIKPVVFVILCSLVYTLIQQIFLFEDGYINFAFEQETYTNLLFQWISEHYGYSNLLMAFFIALWIKLFFRKSGYNIFEILILLCFVMGNAMLIFALFGIADALINHTIIDKGFLLGIIYIAFAISDFFKGNKVLRFSLAFLSYMLGLFTFSLVVMLSGVILDAIFS